MWVAKRWRYQEGLDLVGAWSAAESEEEGRAQDTEREVEGVAWN